MDILLLSAYDTISHRKWHQSLVSNLSDYRWEVLTLAPRFFNYRVRTNSVSWHYSKQSVLAKKYDLILATSLSDITMLKALNPNLGRTPVWLYCHENQFAYPKSSNQVSSHLLEVKTAFYFNCLTANKISFNSAWNRSTALAGMRELLKNWPERIPQSSIDLIEEKSDVIPVPLSAPNTSKNYDSRKKTKLEILWNHRWEYDKGPKQLLAFVAQLDLFLQKNRSTSITFHVVGQSL